MGWAVACMVIPSYADINGRRTPFISSQFLNLIIYPFLMTVESLYLFYFFCFLFGGTICGVYTIGYCIFVESLPGAFQTKAWVCQSIIATCVLSLISLYFQFLSKNWIYLQYMSFFVSFTGLTLSLLYLRENPRYLMEKGRRKEALLEFQREAEVNGKLVELNRFVAMNYS